MRWLLFALVAVAVLWALTPSADAHNAKLEGGRLGPSASSELLYFGGDRSPSNGASLA